MRLLDHTLQQQLLVCGLDLREVALNPVELRAVRHVEDLGDVQLLKQQLRILGLVYTEVVKEQREVIASKLLRELTNKRDEDFSVYGSGMDRKVNESSILTDCRDERQSLDLQVRIDDLDPVPSVGPALGPKCVEREHCLIKVNHSSVRLLHLL